MRTIHISMTSTFQCEYCQCFTLKRCDKKAIKVQLYRKLYRNTLRMTVASVSRMIKKQSAREVVATSNA